MNDFVQSKFAKIVLSLVCVSLAISLLATVSCDGPIDQIFTGWRDSTICMFNSSGSCFIGSSYEEKTALGAGALAIFLIAITVIYVFIFIIRKNLSMFGGNSKNTE